MTRLSQVNVNTLKSLEAGEESPARIELLRRLRTQPYANELSVYWQMGRICFSSAQRWADFDHLISHPFISFEELENGRFTVRYAPGGVRNQETGYHSPQLHTIDEVVSHFDIIMIRLPYDHVGVTE